MFSTKRYPNTREMKIFRAYYGSISAQCVLSLFLYWTLFAESIIDSKETDPDDTSNKTVDNDDPDPKPPIEDNLTYVALLFIPTILMTLGYTLMYV